MRPRTPRNWHGRKWGADRLAAEDAEREQREAERRNKIAAREFMAKTVQAIRIQTQIRCKLARTKLRRHKAAAKIQSLYRMYPVRKQYLQVLAEAAKWGISAHEAATTTKAKATGEQNESAIEAKPLNQLDEVTKYQDMVNLEDDTEWTKKKKDADIEHGMPFGRRFEGSCGKLNILPLLSRRDLDLSNINLKHYGIGQESAGALADALKSADAAGMRAFNVEGNHLKAEAAARLLEGLGNKKYLQELNLGGNRIGPSYGKYEDDLAVLEAERDGILELVEGEEKQTRLHSVNRQLVTVEQKRFAMSGCSMLCNVIRNSPRLNILILKGNKIGDFGIRCLADELPAAHIKHLDLSDNNITQAADAAVCDFMMLSPEIETLDLSNNCLSLVPKATAADEYNQNLPTLAEAISVKENKLCNLILAWNCLGRHGAYQLAAGLLKNTEITYLDVQQNGIDERGACVLLDAILRNETLETVILDSNPLGVAGSAEVRQLVQSKDSSELNLSVKACGWMAHDNSIVDFEVPSTAPSQGPQIERIEVDKSGVEVKRMIRRYLLDLSNPYDRFAGHRLADIAFNEVKPTEAWINPTLAGKKFVLPDSEPEPDNDWLPREGMLEFDYMEGRSTSKIDKSTRHKRRRQVLHNMLEKRKQKRDGVNPVGVGILSKPLTSLQAAEHLTHQALKVKRKKKQHDMIDLLYCKISDHENDDLFLSRLKQVDRESLRERIGPMFGFNTRNVTGHYKLDLGKPWDNVVACKLAELSASERKRQISLDTKDLSQNGNRECWRNETLGGMPFQYDPMEFIIPVEGILELDFISYVRPPSKATPVSEIHFDILLDALKKEVQTCRSSYVPPPKSRGTSHSKDRSKVENDKWSATMALIWLRKISLTFYVEVPQMKTLFTVFDTSEDQREAFVILWPRLVDEENSHEMLSHFSDSDNQILRYRLGHLSLFNPISPDGNYDLDLAVHEQAAVAKLLLLLSVREPGRNLENESYNGKPLEIPKEWLTEPPTEGMLKLRYITENAATAMMDLRRSLAEQVLGWAFAD